jgi:hypothetical protein
MPKQSIYEVNPQLKSLRGVARRDAIASSRMNWQLPDAAPSEILNRILWRDAKGVNAAYPAARSPTLLLQDADDKQDNDHNDRPRRKK